MSTNDEPETTEAPAEEVSQDAVADLAAAKAEAQDKPQAEETAQVPNTETAEVEEEAKAEPETTLTTEPEHDIAWYQKAYEESTREALRLKGELDKKVEPPPIVTPVTEDEVLTPEQLYVRTQLIKESDQAFATILQKYPDVNSPENRERFKQTSEEVSKVIVASEKRFPEALELYEKTAVILGLTPDNSDTLSSAVKDAASSPRTSSAPASPPPQSKVTEDMISANQKMYPGKSRQEIIEELEPHIK